MISDDSHCEKYQQQKKLKLFVNYCSEINKLFENKIYFIEDDGKYYKIMGLKTKIIDKPIKNNSNF